jgi:hypothetical protein
VSDNEHYDVIVVGGVIRRGPAATAVMLGERGADFFNESS